MATEHGGATTAFGAEIGRLDPGRWFDAVLIDFDRAMYPYQDDDIPPLDALIQRAKTQHVAAVMGGRRAGSANTAASPGSTATRRWSRSPARWRSRAASPRTTVAGCAARSSRR